MTPGERVVAGPGRGRYVHLVRVMEPGIRGPRMAPFARCGVVTRGFVYREGEQCPRCWKEVAGV